MFIGITSRTVDDFRKVQRATDVAAFKNVGRAAFAIRQDAIDSIRPAEGPSRPGRPPHTHTQRLTRKGRTRRGHLPRAIAYSQDRQKQTAIIGPRMSVVGTAGEAHEFGGRYKKDSFPQRPFMGPALQRNAARFGRSFQGSLGE